MLKVSKTLIKVCLGLSIIYILLGGLMLVAFYNLIFRPEFIEGIADAEQIETLINLREVLNGSFYLIALAYAIGFIVPLVVEIISICVLSKTHSKSDGIAIGILMIVFSLLSQGLLGLIAGILLLVAPKSEYENN